ncbi:hypothetical protein MHYP_G00250120 [Metynnis hypsauchen]
METGSGFTKVPCSIFTLTLNLLTAHLDKRNIPFTWTNQTSETTTLTALLRRVTNARPVIGWSCFRMWLHLRQRNADNVDRNFPLTWTNQISAQTSASKTLTIIRAPAPVSETERSMAVLLTLVCVLFSRISGAEVEMSVRPGDDVTLYSDCVWEKLGFNTVWFRNSSCQHEPPLIISHKFKINDPQHYTFVWNPSNKTHDLLVKNVSESDLGLYYCAIHEKKVIKDENGVILNPDVYQYGNRTTRLSFLVPCSTDIPQTTSTPPVSDCSVCWKVLVSVCPVCALLSSTCVYCICWNRFKEAEAGQEWRNKTQSGKSRKTEEVEADEVCYASLDILSRGQKRLKKKRVESSDFSTYSEVKTDRM